MWLYTVYVNSLSVRLCNSRFTCHNVDIRTYIRLDSSSFGSFCRYFTTTRPTSPPIGAGALNRLRFLVGLPCCKTTHRLRL